MQLNTIDHKAIHVSQNDHTLLKDFIFFSFLVGDALDIDDTSLSSSTEDENETVIKEMMQHVENDTASALMDDVDHEEEVSNDDGDDDDVDDVIQDPNYTPTCDDSSTPENESNLTTAATTSEQQHQDEDVDLNNSGKKKRNKRLSPSTWKQNESKQKRLKGLSYKSKCGKEVSAKAMGPPCNSKFCQRVSTRDCQVLTKEQRQWVFDKIWAMNSWEERRLYVTTLVTKVNIKQKKVAEGSRRNSSLSYQLQLEDRTSVNVCKALFSSTLGLPERTITEWLNDPINPVKQAAAPSKSGPKSGKQTKVEPDVKDFIKNWLRDLPSVDSHYCRSTATYKDKRFLYPGTTISQLHRYYQQAAAAAGLRAVGVQYFTTLFHEENYSVFIPRKDQCDVCVSYKHGNISKADYDTHVTKKDEARQEKSRDKDSATEEKSLWTMDLQAVLLCPKTQASSQYYKKKLQVHNFTLFNLASKEGYCYVWDESEGDLCSEVFAHLQYHHFEGVIQGHPELKEIIVWSDGCGYQNRNACVANAYSELARKYGVLITQKYLVAGHTQMECDSMDSTIERKIVADIFTPRDYVIILQTARIRPSPYHVKVLKHDEFLKLNASHFLSIRPGKKAGDLTVHDLRALQFSSEGKVHFKLSFSEASVWEELPQRVQAPNGPMAWIRLPCALPIQERKFQDLQSMKPIMPAECHHFFDNLPHKYDSVKNPAQKSWKK